MITLILSIMVMLSLGLIIIMGVAIGWWLIPVAILLVLARKTFDSAKSLFRSNKKDDVVTMSRSEFEKNYQRRSES